MADTESEAFEAWIKTADGLVKFHSTESNSAIQALRWARAAWNARAAIAPTGCATLDSRPAERCEATEPGRKLVGYVVGMAVHVNPIYPGSTELQPDSTHVVLTCRMKDGWRETCSSGAPWLVMLPNLDEQIAGEIRAT